MVWLIYLLHVSFKKKNISCLYSIQLCISFTHKRYLLYMLKFVRVLFLLFFFRKKEANEVMFFWLGPPLNETFAPELVWLLNLKNEFFFFFFLKTYKSIVIPVLIDFAPNIFLLNVGIRYIFTLCVSVETLHEQKNYYEKKAPL